MIGRVWTLAATGAALIVGCAGQDKMTHPANFIQVHDGDDYSLVYSWEYVPATARVDEHISLEIDIDNVETGGSERSIFAYTLGLVSKKIDGDSENNFMYMQASRVLGIVFDYRRNGAVRSAEPSLILESCKSSEFECASLGGWNNPHFRYRSNVDKSVNCDTSRAEVTSVRSSKDGSKQSMKIKLNLFEDAFQTCSDFEDTEDLFKLNMDIKGTNKLVHALWYGERLSEFRNELPFYDRAHNAQWLRSDTADFEFTVGAPTPSPTRAARENPSDELECPDDYAYIRCSSINQSFKHFVNQPERREDNIERICKGMYGKWCTYCPSGRGVKAGCRPKIAESGARQDDDAICQGSGDPFAALGCKMWQTCPAPELLGGCGSVNQMNMSQLAKKSMCKSGFSYKGSTIKRNDCFWCRGWCRTAGIYKGLEHLICRTPGLFDKINVCPIA